MQIFLVVGLVITALCFLLLVTLALIIKFIFHAKIVVALLKLFAPLKPLLLHVPFSGHIVAFLVALKAFLFHLFSSTVAFVTSGIHGAVVGTLAIFGTIGWLHLSGADPALIDWLKLAFRTSNLLNWPLYAAAFAWAAILVKRGHFFVGNLPIALPVFAFVAPTLLDMPLRADIATYFAGITAFWVAFAYYVGRRAYRWHQRRQRLPA